ncbi:MAG TPA: DUF2877 domain-containing protein [Gemmatimonadaceae bacterium]|nr:DUF2877 domain-containing protein [Gemmatimonadaceae bacterium]
MTTLGAFRTAVYLGAPSGTVIAVLTSDAVALPIGLVIPIPSQLLSLDRCVPREHGVVTVERSVVRLGTLSVVAVGLRSALVHSVGSPLPERVCAAYRMLAPQVGRCGLSERTFAGLVERPSAERIRSVVDGLVGRGPGLTPTGDDFLCGVLIGGVLFARDVVEIRRAVLARLGQSPHATVALSAQLLRRACVGEAAPEIESMGRALCRPDRDFSRAVRTLLNVGHSSGAALAYGVLAACDLPVARARATGRGASIRARCS